jgi:hypothetical protein
MQNADVVLRGLKVMFAVVNINYLSIAFYAVWLLQL